MQTGEDSHRIMEILEAALARPEAERGEYIQSVCGSDAALLSAVSEALEWEERMGGFLRQPALVTFGAAAMPTQIGPYQLIRKLGEGGMGVVYHARQTHPIRRDVALKIVKPGMDSRQVIARFEGERQALAMMDHPNITRVFDAGATPSGHPFFVMGLVDGVPITKFCEAQRLGVRERLQLFMSVCGAIQHAHQKGIIHRDIKPSNILVEVENGNPVPHVIDFGIAKATGTQLTDSTVFTQAGLMVGTIEYMSPEQADLASTDIDTRSDIYSLGVVLYELLTGTTPLGSASGVSSLEGTIRAIREQEAIPPSRRPGSSLSIDRELDWIVTKALEKERERRYQTANAMMRDIERYLTGEVVEAGPASATYRMRKFARKHRLALATATAFVFLLLAASIITGWQAYLARQAETAANAQRDRADAETASAKAVLDFLQNDLLAQASSEGQNDPGTTISAELKVREALDRAAARVQTKFQRQPLVEASIRHTIGVTYQALGFMPACQAQLERAFEIRHRLLRDEHPDTIASMSRLANCYTVQGRYDRAEPLLRQAFESGKRVLGEGDPMVLEAAENLAVVYYELGRMAQSGELMRWIVETTRRVKGAEHPDMIVAINDLAHNYADLGKLAEAEEQYRKAIDLGTRRVSEDRMLMPVANLGNLYSRQGKYAQAEPYLKRALEGSRRTLNPENPFRLFAIESLGGLYRDRGRFAEAEGLYKEVWGIRRRILGEEHRLTIHDVSYLGNIYCAEGKWDVGEQMLLKAYRIQRQIMGEAHTDTRYSMSSLALCYMRQRKFVNAEPWAANMVRIYHQSSSSDSMAPEASALLADIELRLGKIAEADLALKDACSAPANNWYGYYCQSLQGASLSIHKSFAPAEPLLTSGYQGLLQRKTEMPAPRALHLLHAKERLLSLYKDQGKPIPADWRE